MRPHTPIFQIPPDILDLSPDILDLSPRHSRESGNPQVCERAPASAICQRAPSGFLKPRRSACTLFYSYVLCWNVQCRRGRIAMVDTLAPIMGAILIFVGIAGIALSLAMLMRGSRD